MMNSWNGGSGDAAVPSAIDQLLHELSQVSFSDAARMADQPGLVGSPVENAGSWDELPRVEGYEILGELGRGGMGAVYRARHIGLDRQVALKMVHAGAGLRPAARQRFLQEARAVGRLHHPNIVQVYDVGEQGGRPFLAMEIVEGGALSQCIGGRPQPSKTAARLIESLARAVHHAHSHGIVHRDLKPSNVLLESPHVEATPRITDFGLAKDLESDAPALTHSGAMLGTPSYMAPEQARGRGESVGPPADVYALGVILYELLTGRPPFRAATPLETLVLVVHDDPVPISRLEPTVPRDLATICLKCLEKEPGRRYVSADALAADVHRFLADEPIVARPVGTLGRSAVLAGFALGMVLWQWRVAVAANIREAQAVVKAESERDAADVARRSAERSAIALQLDRGESLCEQGDVPGGMAIFARTLEQAGENGADELIPVLRANIAAWAGQIPTPRDGLALQGVATAMAFSGNNRRLAIARTEIVNGKAGTGEVLVWDVEGWRPYGRPIADNEPLMAVACSADGARVATYSLTGGVRLWDVATGTPIAGPFTETGRLSALAVSADGRRFMAGGASKSGRGEARIWIAPEAKVPIAGSDSKAGAASRLSDAPVLVLDHPGRVNAVAFTPDGVTAVTGYNVPDGGDGITGGEVQVWDATTGERRGRPIAHARPVTAVAVSARGHNIVSGSADQVARIWNLETGQPVGVPRINPFPADMAAFADDGKTIVTGLGSRSLMSQSNSCGAILWDAASGRTTNSVLLASSGTACAAIRPDGRQLAVSGRDGHLRTFDIGGKRPLFEKRFAFPLNTVVFSPDDRFLLTVGGLATRSSAQLWSLATGRSAGPSIDSDSSIIAAAFDPNGQSVVLGNRNGEVASWDAIAGRPVVPDPVGPVGQSSLIMFARKGDNRQLDAASGRSSGIVPRFDKTVTAIAFSPDGRRAIVGEVNKAIRAWDTTTGEWVGGSRPVGAIPWHIAFSPDGSRFLTVGGDGSADWGRVQVWTAANLEPLSPVLPPPVAFTAAAFDPHGKMVATGGRDGDVRLWDAVTGRSLGSPLDHAGAIRCVCFDAAGRRLAIAGADGIVKVWAVPEPIPGSSAEVRRWVENRTGQKTEGGLATNSR
jgi:WD40 repeat protein